MEEVVRYSPKVSVDCVVFGYSQNQLKVLVLKFKNTEIFCLPGGFMHITENLDEAAKRILENRTSVKDIYLEQFKVFDRADRIDFEIIKVLNENVGFDEELKELLLNRFISIGYFSLVDYTKIATKVDYLSQTIEWYEIDNVPKLMHDHNEMVESAREALIGQLYNKAVGKNLMPPQFTMNELQKLHEAILGTPLIRTNFQRKMLSLGILNRIEKKFTGGAHKAPYLYEFK